MEFVGDKLAGAIEELRVHARQRSQQQSELQASMYDLMVAHLGLHNMLDKADDWSLPARLLAASPEELDAWLAIIEREGDVARLAGLQSAEVRPGQ